MECTYILHANNDDGVLDLLVFLFALLISHLYGSLSVGSSRQDSGNVICKCLNASCFALAWRSDREDLERSLRL